MNKDSFKGIGFSEQKLALLASILAEEGTQIEQRRGITRRENPHEYPLSAGQRRMWFLDQLEPGVHYNENFDLRLKGELDIAILERTLQEILTRHEAMRSSFVVRDGQPVQRIMPTEPIRLPVIDLRGVPEQDRPSEAVRLAVEEARRPFNLATGPLWRFSFLLLAEDEGLLLITAHHIATDGWSFGVFLNEFRLLYEAFRAGGPSPLSDPLVQYADYAAWQNEWLNSEAAQQQLSYWTRHLSGAPALLELPADRPRPPIQTFRGARHQLALPKPLTAALRVLSQHQGVTLFMTLLAAFQALISRYTGRDDIVVGAPIANRTLPESEGLIGFFVNTLVMRGDLSGDPPFVDLLQRIRQTTIGGFQNQDLPVETVVDALRPQRSESYAPLFQVVFALQNLPKSKWELPQLSMSLFLIDNDTTKFDLTLFLSECEDGTAVLIEYATDLFDAVRIERMGDHFLTMLEGIVSNPNERLSRLPLLTEGERHQLLVDWNDTEVDYPANACIHELFEMQAQRTPEAVAVEFEGSQLCYRGLNERANQLAHYLRTLGVKPDGRVAICMERSVEMIVGLLGVLKAGGAYIPLDPASPGERLRWMLEDSGATTLLTESSLGALFGDLPASLPVLDLGAGGTAWSQEPSSNLERSSIGLTPAHLAYVIYTSGSTGTPKGVAVEHRSLANLVHWHVDAFAVKCGQRSSSVAGLGFDATIWEIWPALCAGAAVILPSSAISREPQKLLEWWRKQRLDVSFLPTPLAELAFSQGLDNTCLHTLLIGGDRLRSVPKDPLSFALVNNYGPTETTVVATSGSIESSATVVSIGRPIANTRVYILDGQGEPVPVGVAGELYIGGAGVARGYLNRPELTAERFLKDSFAQEAGARMYRTGDLVRWLPDGSIEFLGRNDFQVKIRGFRIELGEIEARLAAHPAVREAVVVAREDSPGDKRLVAYYATVKKKAEQAGDGEEKEEVVEAAQLRVHLGESLPEYMVPAAYVRLEALPLTPNGKLDRKALPAPEADAYSQGRYEDPQGETETLLAALWAEMLGIAKVGRNSNFFDLGGHSLLAIRVASKLEKVFARKLPVTEIFRHPTVGLLAKYLTGHDEGVKLTRSQEQIEADKASVQRHLERRRRIAGTQGGLK